MTGGTVADALQKVGVTLDENDISSVHVSEQVSDGLNICVSRVEYGPVSYTHLSYCCGYDNDRDTGQYDPKSQSVHW